MSDLVRRVCEDCGVIFWAESRHYRLCGVCKAEHLRQSRRVYLDKVAARRVKKPRPRRVDPRTPPKNPPAALRPDGPLEFIERVDSSHWKVRCKVCGQVVVRFLPGLYGENRKSCGCDKSRAPRGSAKKPRPVPKDAFPRICITCGKEFMAGRNAKYCPECIEERKRLSARNRARKNALGWTDERIAATPENAYGFQIRAVCARCGKVFQKRYKSDTLCADCIDSKRRESGLSEKEIELIHQLEKRN